MSNQTVNFILSFGFSFILTIFSTLLIRKVAFTFDILDHPDGDRKKHRKSVPLLGGVAIWLSFWIVVGSLALYTHTFVRSVHASQLIGMGIGSLILLVIGVIDDVYTLSPRVRLLITIFAALVVVGSGIGLKEITNPFGGVINLNRWPITIEGLNKVFVLGDVIVFFWLMGMMYTTKVLDGLDGLATGITLIGSLMIFFLTQTTRFYQPEVGLLALIVAGCCAGFLLFNFNPARIFLGESGSLFLGLILGILAVISGGKIATALLAMAVPILDLLRVIVVRLISGKNVFAGDREHLHFRLLDGGFSERATVLLLYAISFSFGITTLILPSKFKLLALLILTAGMFLVSAWLRKQRKYTKLT